ncbi:MAG: twin-arginine translocase TatA/TatE family subunit [Pseudomonadota bacterium]
MQPSFLHILVVVVLIVLLFGRGKIADLMGDVATGIKNFKKGLSDDDSAASPQKRVDSKSRAAKSKKADKTKA